MTYNEIRELKRIFYTSYRSKFVSNYGKPDVIINYNYRSYGGDIIGSRGRHYGTYRVLPIPIHPKKGDIIETFYGQKFIFMNILKTYAYSCLIPGTKVNRHHVPYTDIKSINGIELYKINPMIVTLLNIIK